MKRKHSNKSNFGKGDWKSYFRLIPYIRLPWLLIAIGFVVSLTYSEVMAYVPVSTSALFSGEFTGSALWEAVVYNVLNYALMFASLILVSWVSAIAVRRAKDRIWSRMLRLDMAYYDAHDPANLTSTLTNDCETAVNSLVSQLISLIPNVYYLVRVCMTLNSYDFSLLLSVLILVPVNIAYVVILGRWKYEVNAGIFARIGSLTGYLAERVTNIFLIRSYTNEKQEEENGVRAAGELYHARVRAAKVTMLSDLGANLMEVLQKGLPIVFGMILLQRNVITMPEWIAFFLFVTQIITRINGVVSSWMGIKEAQGAAARMVDIFTAPEEPDSGAAQEGEIASGDIVFHDIRFSYGKKEVLHGINATIPAGKTTALVGRCGSGKTTLISLLERMYVPDSGTITLEGKDISAYNLKNWRDHFSYVQQDAGVFGGTLGSAMTYGIHTPVSEEMLRAAAEKTGAMALVNSSPQGFDTPLAPSGTSVSGGQRQRIVLTRELLKKRPVMLLDEPTSALDAMSAFSIQEKILQLFDGTTKLMITHDLRLLARVDHVIFLADGVVADSGSPQELMQRCGAYRELVQCSEEARA